MYEMVKCDETDESNRRSYQKQNADQTHEQHEHGKEARHKDPAKQGG